MTSVGRSPEQRRQERLRAKARQQDAAESAARVEATGADIPPPPIEPEPTKPTNTVRRKHRKTTGTVSPEALASLHEVVVVAVAGASMFVPEAYRPTSQDIDAIFMPAERIYLRHASVPEISPDTTDAIACLIGVAGYLSHVKYPSVLRRQRSRNTANGPTQPASPTPANAGNNAGTPDPNTARENVPNPLAEALTSLHRETWGIGPDNDNDS